MYSINGVPLDNALMGWEMLAPSLPLPGVKTVRTSAVRAGRDGEFVSSSRRGPTSLKFTVRSPRRNLAALLALFSSPELVVRELANPDRTATAVLESGAPEYHFPKPDVYSYSFIVAVPGGALRGPVSTSPLVAAAPAGAKASLFPGLSAPVQDALVRLRGPLENPQLVDSSGAFLAVAGTIPANKFVRFDMDTGRAWLTESDTWSGGTEISGQVDFGGPRGVFEITPTFTDPATRAGSLTFTQDSFNTGAGVQVRGRAAYLI